MSGTGGKGIGDVASIDVCTKCTCLVGNVLLNAA